MASTLDRILRWAFARIVSRGNLTVVTPAGTRLAFGDGSGEPVTVRLTDRAGVIALLTDPDMRLGELYMDGRLTVETGTVWEGTTPCAAAAAAPLGTAMAVSATPARRIVSNRFMHSPFFASDPGCGTLVRNGES